ncbi:hypothetical protein C8R46DRAFT_422564 [Mycena filopes]|nr:hypothetical protein C8R46DRAFT_422564 [Mycena filopes]
MFLAGAQRLRRLTFFCSLFIQFATSAVIVRNATNGQSDALIHPAALENRQEFVSTFTTSDVFTSIHTAVIDVTETVDKTQTSVRHPTVFETLAFATEYPIIATLAVSTSTISDSFTSIHTVVIDATEIVDKTQTSVRHLTQFQTEAFPTEYHITTTRTIGVTVPPPANPVAVQTSGSPRSSSVAVQASNSQTAPSTPIPTSSSESSSPGSASSSRGTTRQKRTAIALGVTLGLLFPLLVVPALYLLLRRRRRAAVMRNDATSAAHRPGSDNLDLESGVNRSSWMSTSSGHALLPPNGVPPTPKPSPALGPRSKKGKLYITNQVESAWEKVVELRRMTITLLRPSSVNSTRKSGSSWTAPPLGDGPVSVSGGAESSAGVMDADKLALAMREIDGLNSRIRELEALGGASIATSSLGPLDELAPPVYAE